MRVLIDGEIFVRQSVGGVTRYFAELHRALRRSGVQSRIVAPLHRCEYLMGLPAVHGVRVSDPGQGWATTLRWISYLSPWIGDTDVIHKTWYGGPPTIRPRVPHVLTVHDLTHERFPEYFGDGDYLATMRAGWIRYAAHVLVVSENTRRDLLERYPALEDRTSVTPLAPSFDAGIAVPAPADWPRRWVLFVGGRKGYKNFSAAMRSFARAIPKDVSLLVFGAPPEDAERALAQELGIASRVHWTRGGDSLLAAAYAGAVALLYPSLYEGFGIPPLEAMACGCPVICSDRASLPEVVGEAAVSLDPERLDDWVEALRSVCDHETLRADLVERGKSRAREFTWDNTAARTVVGYRAALDE